MKLLESVDQKLERVNQLNERKRKLMLQVWDGHDPVVPWLHTMDNLYRCEEILSWLINNKLVGIRFIQYLRHDHENSLLKMCSHILKTVLGYNEPRPIVAGKDWR